MHLGMDSSEADERKWRGTDEGAKLKETGTVNWDKPNKDATNQSGFSALPGGFRTCQEGSTSKKGTYSPYLGVTAVFWSATEANKQSAWYRYLYYNYSELGRNFTNKQNGFSIRLIKD